MPEADERIVGTWALVEASATDEHGTPLAPPYGPAPMGLATFTASGRMMVMVCDGRATPSAQDGERACSFYAGNYRFDGETLATRVDAASSNIGIGSDQRRRVEFRDGTLVLRPPPRRSGGATQLRRLVWRRIG